MRAGRDRASWMALAGLPRCEGHPANKRPRRTRRRRRRAWWSRWGASGTVPDGGIERGSRGRVGAVVVVVVAGGEEVPHAAVAVPVDGRAPARRWALESFLYVLQLTDP